MHTGSVVDPDPGSGAFLTPGWVKSQDPDTGPGSGMNNLELRNHFLGSKYLNSLMLIRYPGWKNSDPGYGITPRIRNTAYWSIGKDKNRLW
jgi:hypothetical protein